MTASDNVAAAKVDSAILTLARTIRLCGLPMNAEDAVVKAVEVMREERRLHRDIDQDQIRALGWRLLDEAAREYPSVLERVRYAVPMELVVRDVRWP